MAVMSLKQVQDEGGTCRRISSLSKVHVRLLHGDFSSHACVFTFLYSVKRGKGGLCLAIWSSYY